MYNCIHVHQRELAFCKLSCHHWKIRHGWNMHVLLQNGNLSTGGGDLPPKVSEIFQTSTQQQILASQCFSKSLSSSWSFRPFFGHFVSSRSSSWNRHWLPLIFTKEQHGISAEPWGDFIDFRSKGGWGGVRREGALSYKPPVYRQHLMSIRLNSHYFHIIGDGHQQPNSRGPIYTNKTVGWPSPI